MFYCDECAKKNGWTIAPSAAYQTKAECGECGKVEMCSEAPDWILRPEAEQAATPPKGVAVRSDQDATTLSLDTAQKPGRTITSDRDFSPAQRRKMVKEIMRASRTGR